MRPDYGTKARWRLLASLALAAMAGGAGGAEVRPASPVGDGYRLAWGDEFEGAALDATKWTYREGVRFWSVQKPANVSVSNGLLRLALKRENAGTNRYTAGGVISRPRFKYGYYEARFRCPPDAGWHTSFWTMRHEGRGERAAAEPRQEIDICEQDSVNPRRYEVNLHRWIPPPHQAFGHRIVPTPDLSADFHTWGCEFTPQAVRYYFEGKLVQTASATGFPHGTQNIWLTSIAAPLGGTKAVDERRLPAVAAFDYVRFFTAETAAARAAVLAPAP